MFVKSKMTKTGEPTAFVTGSLTEEFKSHQNLAEPFGEVFTVLYRVDAYWITTRRNGKMGLAYGTRVFVFKTMDLTELASIQNLNLTQLLDVWETDTPYLHNRHFFVEGKRSFQMGGSSQIVWDGSNMWSSGEGEENLIATIFPKLVIAYPNLPDVPAGTIGWYKLK